MNPQDIASIIDLHFEELTDLEQEIARYFLQSETIADDLSSQQSLKNYISLKPLWPALLKSVVLQLSRIYFQYQHQADNQASQHPDHQPPDKTSS